jgi:hypothetical protein
MSPAESEPAIPESGRSQTHALNHGPPGLAAVYKAKIYKEDPPKFPLRMELTLTEERLTKSSNYVLLVTVICHENCYSYFRPFSCEQGTSTESSLC